MEVRHSYAKEAEAEPAATTDTVTYTYSLVNNGLLSLFNISILDDLLKQHGTIITCTNADGSAVEGSTPGVVSGLAAYPDNGLSPASRLICSGTDSVFQDEVRSTLQSINFESGIGYRAIRPRPRYSRSRKLCSMFVVTAVRCTSLVAPQTQL